MITEIHDQAYRKDRHPDRKERWKKITEIENYIDGITYIPAKEKPVEEPAKAETKPTPKADEKPVEEKKAEAPKKEEVKKEEPKKVEQKPDKKKPDKKKAEVIQLSLFWGAANAF